MEVGRYSMARLLTPRAIGAQHAALTCMYIYKPSRSRASWVDTHNGVVQVMSRVEWLDHGLLQHWLGACLYTKNTRSVDSMKGLPDWRSRCCNRSVRTISFFSASSRAVDVAAATDERTRRVMRPLV